MNRFLSITLGVLLLLGASAEPLQAARKNGPTATWGSIDERYPETITAVRGTPSLRLTGWRGERVMAQALVQAPAGADGVTFELSALQGSRGTLSADCAETGFVTAVWTDCLNPDGTGCGVRTDRSRFDSSRVADRIDIHTKAVALAEGTQQGFWLSLDIPRDAAPGRYRGTLRFFEAGKPFATLPLQLDVSPYTLPERGAFQLDLWQNPFAVARVEGVPLWSEAHFAAMRPLMERLARAGQKVVTCSIMHHPWNAQTYDPFTSMITWTRTVDGGWRFGYEVFDRWVEFMFSCGIDGRINCYSMVPWALSFPFFDEATATVQQLHAAPGDRAYDAMWTAMLKSFARHLKEKGWFERTAIAMDERPYETMLRTLDVIRAGDPGFHVALAGNWYPELEGDLDDYCLPVTAYFPDDVLAARQARGAVSTVYTCCTEGYPNTFTFSPPAEAEWIGWHVAARGLDGYLRWAYNSWPEDPVHDSRFRTWAAGDTYLVYPGNCPSIRFERLVRGIQAWEKLHILRENGVAVEDFLAPFTLEALATSPAATMVSAAREALGTRGF